MAVPAPFVPALYTPNYHLFAELETGGVQGVFQPQEEFLTFFSTMATSGAMAKAARDKERLRPGQKQRKRLHVLRNPNKIAFRDWEGVPEPWSFDDCAHYIE